MIVYSRSVKNKGEQKVMIQNTVMNEWDRIPKIRLNFEIEIAKHVQVQCHRESFSLICRLDVVFVPSESVFGFEFEYRTVFRRSYACPASAIVLGRSSRCELAERY